MTDIYAVAGKKRASKLRKHLEDCIGLPARPDCADGSSLHVQPSPGESQQFHRQNFERMQFYRILPDLRQWPLSSDWCTTLEPGSDWSIALWPAVPFHSLLTGKQDRDYSAMRVQKRACTMLDSSYLGNVP